GGWVRPAPTRASESRCPVPLPPGAWRPSGAGAGCGRARSRRGQCRTSWCAARTPGGMRWSRWRSGRWRGWWCSWGSPSVLRCGVPSAYALCCVDATLGLVGDDQVVGVVLDDQRGRVRAEVETAADHADRSVLLLPRLAGADSRDLARPLRAGGADPVSGADLAGGDDGHRGSFRG